MRTTGPLHADRAAAGVAVVVVPEIPGAPVSGAARWLTPKKALIGLNLRGKANDRFWFTFFHEAGRVLLDGTKSTFIDQDQSNVANDYGGNRFAADLLGL